MRNCTRIVLAAVTLVACGLSGNTLLADGYGCCSGDAFGIQRRANRRVIPYFAEHPPVYYSYPVARPYGFSPYALPPGVLPAELKVSPEPQEITNPYYKPRSDEDADATTTASDRTAGREIINPFFVQVKSRLRIAERSE